MIRPGAVQAYFHAKYSVILHTVTLNAARLVKSGQNDVDAVYVGDEEVWVMRNVSFYERTSGFQIYVRSKPRVEADLNGLSAAQAYVRAKPEVAPALNGTAADQAYIYPKPGVYPEPNGVAGVQIYVNAVATV